MYPESAFSKPVTLFIETKVNQIILFYISGRMQQNVNMKFGLEPIVFLNKAT